jgi:hypothetical protein
VLAKPKEASGAAKPKQERLTERKLRQAVLMGFAANTASAASPPASSAQTTPPPEAVAGKDAAPEHQAGGGAAGGKESTSPHQPARASGKGGSRSRPQRPQAAPLASMNC